MNANLPREIGFIIPISIDPFNRPWLRFRHMETRHDKAGRQHSREWPATCLSVCSRNRSGPVVPVTDVIGHGVVGRSIARRLHVDLIA